MTLDPRKNDPSLQKHDSLRWWYRTFILEPGVVVFESVHAPSYVQQWKWTLVWEIAGQEERLFLDFDGPGPMGMVDARIRMERKLREREEWRRLRSS